LGFSHSSLRSQSCWFMAPFTVDGNLVFSQDVIRGLGNFTAFRSPAKCAARIGQAFSDTFTSIALPDSARHELPDTERNGRVFSDGCGTISMKLLRRVWLEYAPGRSPKPTILQIRFAGKSTLEAIYISATNVHRSERRSLPRLSTRWRHVVYSPVHGEVLRSTRP
jgi:hypothetical protein